MAFCINCGQKLAEGAKFCAECGTQVEHADTPQDEQRKVVYEGDLHKCPNCGEVLGSFVSACSSCGYELRGAKASNSVRELSKKLQELEMQRLSEEHDSILSQILANGQLSKIDEQKITLIKSFPIPNAKEDILEFAVLALSNINPDAFDTANGGDFREAAISSAWLSKFEQAYQKGLLLFGEIPELRDMHLLCNKKKKLISKKKNRVWALMAAVFGCVALIFLVIWLAGGFG